MASSTQKFVQHPLQKEFTYDPNCNKEEGIVKAFQLYSKNPASDNSLEKILKDTPWKINLKTSITVQTNGVASVKGKYIILSTFYPNNLEEKISEWKSKNLKTMPLRQFPLSFLTAVFDRSKKYTLFVVPVVMLNPEVASPKGNETVSVRKGAVENSLNSTAEFYVLPPKTAVQTLVSLFIHNNPSEDTVTKLRMCPLFNDFKTAWQLSDSNSSDKTDTKTVLLSEKIHFPKFPSVFLNHEMFKEVTIRSSDYIAQPGEIVKKPAGEATKKRTKRSSNSSSDEGESVAEEVVSEHDTLAFINTDDGFDATPASRKGKSTKNSKASAAPSSSSSSPSPMKTSVVSKRKQTAPAQSLKKTSKAEPLNDDSESSSSSISKPAKKRQTTSASKGSEPVGEKRVSASLLAGSLRVNSITQKALNDSFENVPTVYPASDSSSSSSFESSSDILEKIQACAKMSETDDSADTLVKGFGDEFKDIMEKTMQVFDAFKSDDLVRHALSRQILDNLDNISKKSIQDSDPAWIDNCDLVTTNLKSRIFDIKRRLSVPDDVHLPIGVYATLFGLLKNTSNSLESHAKEGSSMLARPKTEKAQSLFVPMKPNQVPVGESFIPYLYMIFQGAENTDRIVKGILDCFQGTSEGFATTLESSLSTIEALEKKTKDALNTARHRQIKLAKHALRLLKTADAEKEDLFQQLLAAKDSLTEINKTKSFEIEVLKLEIQGLKNEITSLKNKLSSSSDSVKVGSKSPQTKHITLVAKSSDNNYKPPAPSKPLELEDDPIEDFDDALDDSKDTTSPSSPSPASNKNELRDELDDEVVDDLSESNDQTPPIAEVSNDTWDDDIF